MKFKKPKFWDLKKPNIYSYILLPIAFLIQIFAYFKKKTKINDFKIKTICVGNIYVGGTGKTSLCIKINEILKNKNIRSCFIKKFYKDQLDEQKILKNRGQVFSSKVRVDSIKQAEHENYEVAIIDDGLHEFHAGVSLFEGLKQYLSEDGFYIIEDIRRRNYII